MTVNPADLEKYSGKNVRIAVQREGGVEELEGKVETASVIGVAFKTKGKHSTDLIEAEKILGIEAVEVEVTLRQKKLPPLEESKARTHLIDRHGAPLAQVNAMSSATALSVHAGIDHGPLGHTHLTVEEQAEKDAKKSGEAEPTPEG